MNVQTICWTRIETGLLGGTNLKFKFHVIFQDFEFIEIIKIC